MKMSDSRIESFLEELATTRMSDDALGQRHPPLDNVAWHDFSRYEYLLVPTYMTQPQPPSPFQGPHPVLEQLIAETIPTGDLTVFTTLLHNEIYGKFSRVADFAVKEEVTHLGITIPFKEKVGD